MKKKLQVFVSSTYTDMLHERQAAVEAILRAGHIPAGMELFAAGDESQLETIQRWIDDSDIFMLILGGRYGSIDAKFGKSYIELEYEYAVAQRKPLFAALIDKDFLEAKVKQNGQSAVETTNGVNLNAFRACVEEKISRFFGNLDQLKLIVFESLARYDLNEGLSGWIRGTDVPNANAALEEIVRLQREKAELAKSLADVREYIQTLQGSSLDATGPSAIADNLGDEAKRLLLAATSADGYIMFVHVMGGTIVQVGTQSFLSPEDGARKTATWKAAIQELVAQRLVEDAGSKGETFQVTKYGYDVAEQIEGKLPVLPLA